MKKNEKTEKIRDLARRIDKLQTKERNLRTERLKLEKRLHELEERLCDETFDLDRE